MNTEISIMLVTWNRFDQVKQCWKHNMANAGRAYDEVVWVDNGSTDGTAELAVQMHPDTLCLNKSNSYVSRGYNRAFRLCTKPWIAMVGDRNLQPDGWLQAMHDVISTQKVDSIATYELDPRAIGERHLPPAKQVNIGGHECFPVLPQGSMCFRRSLLETAGYVRDDMGGYGWNDIEWARRLASRDIRSYAFCNLIHHHMHDPSGVQMNGEDYVTWKWRERDDPSKQAKLDWCRDNHYPHFEPNSY